MEFWIDIQDSSGNKYGSGPIVTATGWETTARLDRAGRFSFGMPASDPKAALVQAKREAWCWAIIADEITLIGAGIIDQIETTVDPAGAPELAISGDDLLRELTYRSVGFLEIVTSGGLASLDALDEIIDEAPPAWSLDTVTGYAATENEVYAKFAGETVLAALNKVGEHTGEHFRLGSGKEVVWLQDDLTDSGVRAIGQADPSAVGDNDDVCLITELVESQGSYDLCTRLFAFGAGNGQARVSLADTSVSAHVGYVIDKSNPKGANLTHSAAFATYGQIERFLSWKEISPISNTDADIESAANALYAAAYQYLSRYCQVQYSYRLSVTKLEKPVLPGQKIRVIWREVVDGYAAVDIDTDLTVLETTTKLDAAGLRTVAMQVSTIDAWPQTLAEIIAGQLEEARLMDGHPQTFAGYYSEGLGNFNISPTYSAVARFKFDDRITRLVSAKLRFRTNAFETTASGAASGGGSSQSSSSGGGSTQSSSSGGGSSQSSSSQGSHSHSVGITVVGGPASSSYDVYWDPDEHRFHLPSVGEGEDDQQAQTSSSGGSHSHSVSIPNHSHNTTIPNHSHNTTIPNHTHPLTYGIVRSGTYPGEVTIWINGVNRTFELTGLTSLGTATGSTGIVEVELADILNADFRREHTIELKCSSGYGVILNMALRCFVIVQAILLLPAAPDSPTTPAEPTVAVAATVDGWRVTWLAVSGAESYRLYGNTVGSDSGAEEITLTTSREVLVPYSSGFSWFAATAIAGSNESDIGPWATDASAPANPSWISHLYQPDGHFVHWYHPDLARVENFVLYRNTIADESGATEVETVSGFSTSYLYPYAAGGDYFGVKAVSYAGVSSDIIWFGPYSPTPGAPSPVPQMVEFGGFVVSWAAVAGAARYEVQGATDDTGTGAALKWSGQALYTPVIAETGVAWFRVRAQGYDDSYSDWSSWVTDSVPPPQPTIATLGGIKAVTVSLAAADTSHSSPGFSHYVLEVADDASGTGATTLDSHALYASFPRTFDQITGLTKYFRLTPYDWAGNDGTPSTWTPATPSPEGAIVQDKFDGYGGSTVTPLESLYWLRLHRADQVTSIGSAWTWTKTDSNGTLSLDTAGPEGAGGVKFSGQVENNTVINLLPAIFPGGLVDYSNDGRFTDDDYILLFIEVTGAQSGTSMDVRIETGSPVTTPTLMTTLNLSTTGKYYLKIKRGDISGSWDAVAGFSFKLYRGDSTKPNVTVIFDDIRVSKADPDAPATYNDTGQAWDFGASTGSDVGEWHIYEGNRTGEPKKPFSLGQIKTATTPDRWYLAYKPDLNILSGTIQVGVMHRANGQSGLAFFIKATTPDAWEMYAVEADNVGDTVKLVKYVGGTRTVLATGTLTGFISGSTAQIAWIGVDFSQYDTDAGRIKVYASLTEGNLIQAGNLRISTQDTDIGSGGTVGLLSNQANTRFVNFVAGSPAHAEVADVALALDGSWIVGDVRRLHYDRDLNLFNYTDDGSTFSPVSTGLFNGQPASAYALQTDIRERLTGNRTYYVRTDGNDSNNGLTNSSGGAFLTLQKAMNVISNIDNAGYTVTVQIGNGTYTSNLSLLSCLGSGAIVFVGDESTPANVIISVTNASCVIGAAVRGVFHVRGVELRVTTSGHGIVATGGSTVWFQNVRFGAVANSHILAQSSGVITATGNYTISGNAQRHMDSNLKGVIVINGRTVTLSGTPAFSLQFGFCGNVSNIYCPSNTYSGAATGTRYQVSSNGSIDTAGGGGTYLPGNAAGATASGGQYN